MALTPYKKIDDGDLAKALILAGSARRSIDRNDFPVVIREMEAQLSITPAHIRGVDDADVGTLIVKQQTAQASDVTVPAVSVFAPLDNATGVATTVSPGVTFNEQIVFGSGTFSLFLTTGNVLVHAWSIPANIGSGLGQAYITGGNKVNLRPPAVLAAATQHYITWTAGAVRDLAGNNAAAQASTTVWSFTTA